MCQSSWFPMYASETILISCFYLRQYQFLASPIHHTNLILFIILLLTSHHGCKAKVTVNPLRQRPSPHLVPSKVKSFKLTLYRKENSTNQGRLGMGMIIKSHFCKLCGTSWLVMHPKIYFSPNFKICSPRVRKRTSTKALNKNFHQKSLFNAL